MIFPRPTGWCLLLILGLGCSPDAAPRGTVKGRVTHKGQPVTGATVHFENREGAAEGRAPLDADGRYEMKTYRDEGLPPGVYKVAVAPGRIMEPGEEIPLAGQGPKTKPPPSTAIAVNYHRSATTDLTADVKAGDNPPFDFDLKP